MNKTRKAEPTGPCVYVLRVGKQDRFKIGQTSKSSESRRKSLSTGSGDKLTRWRELPCKNPGELESVLHNLLDEHRAPNGEFFDVSESSLEDAISRGVELIEALEAVRPAAEALRTKPPLDRVVESTPEWRDLHAQLRRARRDKFLVEKQITLLTSKLQVAIGENMGIAGIATWRWFEGEELEEARLRADQPDVVAPYLRSVAYRKFKVE